MSERGLRPFFSYYGSKYRLARHYPPPRYTTIVEPFAGSAGYSLLYPERAVVLIDLHPKIAGIWSYLIRVPVAEIMQLPVDVNHVDEVHAPEEAKWLIGFWLNLSGYVPGKTPTPWSKRHKDLEDGQCWGATRRDLIASQVGRIRHWRASCGTYRDAPDVEATWHVDPPYQLRGQSYTYSAKDIDFDDLGAWCRSRRGQVMVCENAGAAWLPFRFFRRQWGGNRGGSAEAIWTEDSMTIRALR